MGIQINTLKRGDTVLVENYNINKLVIRKIESIDNNPNNIPNYRLNFKTFELDDRSRCSYYPSGIAYLWGNVNGDKLEEILEIL